MEHSKSPCSLLTFERLSKHFGGVAALTDVSFDVNLGHIHALVGENGAGKSTLMKCLVGVHRPDTGRILLHGKPVSLGTPADARALGIDVVFQEIELAPNLTVAESIFLAREPRRFGLVDHARMQREAAEMLDRLGMPLSPLAPIDSLRTAEKQGVQIARALAQGAKLLVMDEPTSSLSDHEVERLLTLLEALRANGTTIVYVTHKLDEVARLADTITVLRDGRHIATRPSAELDTDSMIALMVGRENAEQDDALTEASAGRPKPSEHHAPASTTRHTQPLLSGRNLTGGKNFQDISFDLSKGEILGLFGIVGAGRTELARALFGLDPLESGTLSLNAKPVRFKSPAEAVAAGLALVPEDRKLQGVLLEESLRRNIALPAMRRVAPRGWVRRADEYSLATESVARFDIAARGGVDQEVKALSGGNQQKVVIAKWLATKPQILILDEPTKGIDIGAKREVHALIRRFADEGLAVLLISSELNEILALSDRIIVMRGGRVAATVDAASATRESLLRHAVS